MKDQEKLIESVKIEAANLRKNATELELSRLDIYSLQPKFKSDCVYGQMTGSCNSYRAKELIEKCCKMVYKASEHGFERYRIIKDIFCDDRTQFYLSPLEKYILTANKYNLKILISYLKKETEELDLI